MTEDLRTELIRQIASLRCTAAMGSVLDKPLDTGNRRVSASMGVHGRICSIGAYHPHHGYVVAHNHAQFPADQYEDTPFVRSYRRKLADVNGPGFGLEVLLPGAWRYAWFGPNIAGSLREQDGLSIVSCVVPDQVDPNVCWQVVTVENRSAEKVAVPLRFSGEISINRSSFGQLTERGPIKPPPCVNHFRQEAGKLRYWNPNLQVALLVEITSSLDCSFLGEGAEMITDSPVQFKKYSDLCLNPGKSEVVVISFCLNEGERSNAGSKLANLVHSLATSQGDASDYIVERNLAYILNCCTIPVDKRATCLITDHQLLPLSWNRDAYYAIEFIRSYGKINRQFPFQDLMKNHLYWMFVRAEKVKGFWGRAYLANGVVKDHTFQLDQQLYPIIELAAYYRDFADQELLTELRPYLATLLDNLFRLKDALTPFLPTEETPADDGVEFPYHFSSQVLWWKALVELSELGRSVSLPPWDFLEEASTLRQAIYDQMVADYAGRAQFCYLTDLDGQFRFYHDANDLPTVYAPEWGFCSADDPIWRNTLRFGFSPANQGGFYGGKYGGLGSVHTAAPWPLGMVQQLIFSRLVGEQEQYLKTLEKLRLITQVDGLLPEAINAQTGETESRHWFAWPGAVFSTELLKSWP